MEEIIKQFLAVSYGDGSGYGYGSGSGSGDGSGYGDGSGSGYGSGSGDGSGSGYGSGSGSGYGSGSGSGNGYGIKSINNQKVYTIDSVKTIIYYVHDNYAKGAILQSDLTLKPCWIAKCGDFFAHADTLHTAVEEAQAKHNQNLSTEERIAMFITEFQKEKKYPAHKFFAWHNTLTGSCKMGRKNFCEEHGIDIDNDQFTVAEFIELTINSYGGEIIKELQKQYEQ